MGEGVFLVSDAFSFGGKRSTPAGLVKAFTDLTDHQLFIVREQRGLIEQFIGGCVVAYWPPSEETDIVEDALGAAERLVTEKVKIAGLDYRVSVKFVAAELAGAFFGPASAHRFQVVGKARDRSFNLPTLGNGNDGVLTNEDTLGKLPRSVQLRFAEIAPAVFALKFD